MEGLRAGYPELWREQKRIDRNNFDGGVFLALAENAWTFVNDIGSAQWTDRCARTPDTVECRCSRNPICVYGKHEAAAASYIAAFNRNAVSVDRKLEVQARVAQLCAYLKGNAPFHKAAMDGFDCEHLPWRSTADNR